MVVVADGGRDNLEIVPAASPSVIDTPLPGAAEPVPPPTTEPGSPEAADALPYQWSRVPHNEAVFGGAEIHSVTVSGAGLVAVGDESLESLGTTERQEAIESGDAVFVWVTEPED